MKAPAFGIALLLGFAEALAGGPVLPNGWRLPSRAELGDEWRSGDQRNATVVGDFDGDGLVEGAFLTVSTDGTHEGLMAFVSRGDKDEWFVLNKQSSGDTVFMGLDKYPPGEYEVMCDTDAECALGDRKRITIHNDAFVYYRPESAASIFIWNSAKRGFDRLWESD